MIDLTEFCSKDVYRTNITTPWNDGEYALATCGALMVRVPRQDGLTERLTDGIHRPDYRRVITVPVDAEYVAQFPAIKEMERKCAECGGSGTDQIDCEDCSGTGSVDCPHCCQEMDCEECDGTGKKGDSKKVCNVCNGSKVLKYTLHEIGENHYTSLLLDKIKDLPGIRIANAGHMKPTHFIFDGGDGVIMPTRE